jgi:hypothetical protein
VGQRKLWGIVGLARRYPAHCVDAACAQALEQGVYSYKRVLALTEASLPRRWRPSRPRQRCAGQGVAHAAQQHELIRDADEYGDLFAHAAATAATATEHHQHRNAPGVQP